MFKPVIIRLAPYLLAALAGFSSAWWIQGHRITELRLEHQTYIADQEELVRKLNTLQLRQKELADHDYAVSQNQLKSEIERGDTYRRCVAAGKCGVVTVRVPTYSSETRSTQATGSTNATESCPVLVGSNATETFSQNSPVIEDCAITVLRLNKLQTLIESQSNY